MKKYLYVYVKIYESCDTWNYRYLSDEDIYKPGDYVLVDHDGFELPVIVTSSRWFNEDKVPYPLKKMKKIIRRSSREEYLNYNTQSIYNYIEARLDKDKKLPKCFSINYFKHDDEYIDGSLDGINFFNGHNKENKKLTKKIINIINKHDDIGDTVDLLDDTLIDESIRASLDSINEYIFNNIDNIDLDYIYDLAELILYLSVNPETMKLGISLMSIYHFEKNKFLFNYLKLLACCEEFTEVVAFYIFRRLKNCNNLCFTTLKKVIGWGRIFLIILTNFDTDEKQNWLINKGLVNNIDNKYTGTIILSKIDVKSIILDCKKEDKKYKNLLDIINYSIVTKVCASINLLDNYKEIFDTFLSIWKYHKDDSNYYATIKNMYLYENKKYPEAFKILESKYCYKTIKYIIENCKDEERVHNCIYICNLSKKYNYRKIVLERFNKNIIKGYYCLDYLLTNKSTKDKITKRLNDGIDIDDIYDSGVIDFANFLDELSEHPLVGLPYVYEALDISDGDVFAAVLTLIDKWNKAGAELPEDLKDFICN